MNIITERLEIRKFIGEDWKAVYEYTSDYNVMKIHTRRSFFRARCKAICN